MTKSDLKDIEEIVEALANWFSSQEVSPSKAVSAMGYLIGVMASTNEPDLWRIDSKLKTVEDLMNGIAFVGYLKQKQQ